MKQGLGAQESQALAYAQLRQLEVVRTGDLARPLRLTAAQEAKLLSRLAKAGLIARVWRGLYLVPKRLPLGGSWSPGEAQALQTLMKSRNARYQVCGPNAFNRYGFDDQLPNRVYAYNNRLSGERRVGSVVLSLIKVSERRLGEMDLLQSPEGIDIPYSSRVRALVDAVYDWSRFNSLPRGYAWIRSELQARRATARELVRVTLRYGDVGTLRRMGALLDREGVDPALLRPLQRKLRPTASFIPWVPSRPKRGSVNRRWGVVWNDEA